MHEEYFRNVVADQIAQSFMLEVLLARYLRSHPPEMWEEIANLLTAVGQRTDHLTGMVKTDEEAEFLSDVVIRSRAHFQNYAERALHRARAEWEAEQAQQ
jgi:hypothetical protein